MEGVRDRKRSGRPRMVCTPQVINTVRSRINRNPVQKQKIVIWKMHIAVRTMSRIIKQDLQLELSNDKQDNILPLH